MSEQAGVKRAGGTPGQRKRAGRAFHPPQPSQRDTPPVSGQPSQPCDDIRLGHFRRSESYDSTLEGLRLAPGPRARPDFYHGLLAQRNSDQGFHGYGNTVLKGGKKLPGAQMR